MMTVHEARQRMRVNNMVMRNTGHGDYRVNYAERDVEATAYYTDDLEDAVLTAGRMRRDKTAIQALTSPDFSFVS